MTKPTATEALPELVWIPPEAARAMAADSPPDEGDVLYVRATTESPETTKTLRAAIVAVALRGEIYEAALLETDDAKAWRIAVKATELIATSPRLKNFTESCTCATNAKDCPLHGESDEQTNCN